MRPDENKKRHIVVCGKSGGEQVQADWSQTDSEQPDYIKNKPELATVATTGDYSDLTNKPTIPAAQVNSDWNAVSGVAQILNKPNLATVATSGSYNDLSNKPTIPAAQVQADWNQSDNTQVDYIKNKPTILTQWFGTKQEYDAILVKDPNVIYNIEGTDNVQADWNQSDSSADDYIKNKPTIPAAQVQSDWNEADSTSLAYIANKPTIPAAQVNSDWNAVSGVAQILNKPTIPTVPAMATETLTFTLQGGTTKTIEFYTVPNYFYVEDVSGINNILSIKKGDSSAPDVEVFYSTDKVNWTNMGTTSTTNITATIPANGKLYLKANTNSFYNNRITPQYNFNVGGNIMSLLYGDNFTGKTSFPSGTTQNFKQLFQTSNSHIINAENLILPATTLANSCYGYMFSGCTSLTTAPELPATTLANNCYQNMFWNCSSLTTAPALPATTLATSCYESMFENCSSLTTAPELPVTSLRERCYALMFKGCSSLATAPATLPATTLAIRCYVNMFQNCTSLTTAPVLKSTSVGTWSCSSMFYGCESLNKVTTYSSVASTTTLSNWLYGVAPTGDFYNLGNASYTEGASGIPSGWTVHTSL